MSEKEQEFITRAHDFLDKAEKTFTQMEQAKTWYRNASIAFLLGLLSFIGVAAVANYRINDVDSRVKNAVSIDAFKLEHDNEQNLKKAILKLVTDSTTKEAAKQFIEGADEIFTQIYFNTAEIRTSRGATITPKKQVKDK